MTSIIMNDKKHDDEMIECSVCLKEVPKSEAKIAEAQDYVQYFCGLECYTKWQGHRPHGDRGRD